MENHNQTKKQSANQQLTRPGLTLGQKAADKLTEVAGSWGFIIGLFVLLCVWMLINVYAWSKVWDPYPFILLNLVLSCLAAIQAPVILMSQNREAERDRMKNERDFAVNRKAEREVEKIQEELEEIKRLLKK